MDSMDNFYERIEALEQRTEQLQQHTRMVERRLRWWRGIACGVIVLALLGFPCSREKRSMKARSWRSASRISNTSLSTSGWPQ